MAPHALLLLVALAAPDRSHTRLVVAVGEAIAFNGKITNDTHLAKALMPLLQADKFAHVELVAPDANGYVAVEGKKTKSADYVIYLSAPYRRVDTKLEGSVSLKVSDTHGGRSIGAADHVVSSASPPEELAKEVATWAEKAILEAIDADLEAIAVNGREVRITLSGLPQIADGEALLEAIAKVPGVNDPRIDGEDGQYDHGKQRFLVHYKGADKNLVSALSKLKVGTRPLKVSSGDEGITAVVR